MTPELIDRIKDNDKTLTEVDVKDILKEVVRTLSKLDYKGSLLLINALAKVQKQKLL